MKYKGKVYFDIIETVMVVRMFFASLICISVGIIPAIMDEHCMWPNNFIMFAIGIVLCIFLIIGILVLALSILGFIGILIDLVEFLLSDEMEKKV